LKAVALHLGNGDGSFQPGQVYALGEHPGTAAVGDFAGHGLPDLVTANLHTVSVLINAADWPQAPAGGLVASPTARPETGAFAGEPRPLPAAVNHFGDHDPGVFLPSGAGQPTQGTTARAVRTLSPAGETVSGGPMDFFPSWDDQPSFS
jgi:hypothetical protein